MNKKVLIRSAILAGAIVAGSATLLIQPGETQTSGSFVALQAATPGTAQAGNVNVTGRAKIGSFEMATGAAAGRVLVSNAGGVGAWTDFDNAFTFPFTGAYSGSSVMFHLTDTGTADVGHFTINNGSSAGEAVQGDTNGIGDAVYGLNTGTGRAGVFQISNASSSATALYGLTNGPGEAVYGNATNSSGASYAGLFINSSNAGFGAYGQCTSTTGTTYGVFGRIASTAGRGVTGWATSATGGTYGGYFLSDSNSGTGAFAQGGNTGLRADGSFYGVNASSDTGYGVYGTTSYANGDAVAGIASDTGGQNYGVFGRAYGTSGRGIYGHASAASGTTYGAVGDCDSASASAYGVYAFGRSGASGVKSFRIDHPKDPANKYLYHYSMEGPEPYNIYTGSVRLDGNGEAWVELPDYYTDINKDARIQLTPAGASMPDLFASEDVVDGRFQVSGGKPNGKVFWEVKAVRNDKWVQRYGAPVESEKEGTERGRYQHPELYGQSEEKSMRYRPQAVRSSGKRAK